MSALPRVTEADVDRLAAQVGLRIDPTDRPDVAAALAWGNRVERAKQLTNWNAKKVLKTLGGPAYVAARRKILAGR